MPQAFYFVFLNILTTKDTKYHKVFFLLRVTLCDFVVYKIVSLRTLI